MPMRVALGADHRGFLLKESIKAYLKERGIAALDFGTDSTDSTDYPDHGRPVAEAVAGGQADFGITVCWTGNGMNMVANKVAGVRAALALDVDMAALARAHNDANVLTLAAKYVTPESVVPIVAAFLNSEFEGGRHAARVAKIRSLEERQASPD